MSELCEVESLVGGTMYSSSVQVREQWSGSTRGSVVGHSERSVHFLGSASRPRQFGGLLRVGPTVD